ncbi:fimbria/pilus outer membrane usher protein [Ferrimonas balearica]|uniref:fimbria/pilus outer membrane usher protein n=1 Tax=Ferrimonas balearica TaxID=44012 RepID=UPI001F15804F|nr:fimbria/pilus outer membrane usher protein [Ferrimonas balearica]MBY6094246.1 fimbria/pilus outer membrane usher protein [Ferrimonas balearica]
MTLALVSLSGRRLWGWLALLPLSVSAMTMTLPLQLAGNGLGDVPVVFEGAAVSAVELPALQSLLGRRVSDEVWTRLQNEMGPRREIRFEQLGAAGITLTLDPATLSLQASIAPQAQGDISVNFGEETTSFSPSPSAGFSWLNSFNLAHNESWQDSDSSRFSSLEWLAQMNLGGADGVNLQLANYLEVEDSSTSVLRGEWRAYYDNPYQPYRLSVGDIEGGVAGHLPGGSFGGIAIESDYASLQPERTIGPTNNQLLVLQESADVEISVNGQVIFSGRQEAGRFNLTNLPMANGANDIVVRITYLSGRTETRVFSQFYNSTLLQQGMVNYAFSAGVPSLFGDDGVEYQDGWAANGFVEYGVSENLTLGLNGVIGQYGYLLGTTATMGTRWGNLSARLSGSQSDEFDFGHIASLSFESRIIGSAEGSAPNLRMTLERASDFSARMWEESQLPLNYDRVLANYVWTINEQWDATLSGAYFNDEVDGESMSASSQVNWRYGDFILGGGVSYNSDPRIEGDEVNYYVTFDWYWAHPQHGYTVGANYNTQNNRARLNASRSNTDRVGSVGFRAQAEYDDFQDRETAMVNYTANRARLEGEVERSNSRGGEPSYTASIRANTAIGFADGMWGWGRAQPGPFLVTQLHPTLEAPVLMGVSPQGGYLAEATPVIGGLMELDLAYASNLVDIDVPNAPLGYDWGQSRYTLSPGAATGHFIEVGSDSAYTVHGILLDETGVPIGYRQGELQQGDLKLSFFTNKTGRFYIQGASPGRYTLVVLGPRFRPLSLEIESSDSSLINLGTYHVECVKEECRDNP